MSIHLTSEVYKREVGNLAHTAVMLLLADKASDDGTGIWASKQRMADEIGASKQTVITTLKSLIDSRLVRETGQRKCANGYTVEYAVNVVALRALPLVRSHRADQSEKLTGQERRPVKEANPTGQGGLPHRSENLTQTVLEPSLNLEEANASSQRARKADPFPKPDWADPQVWSDFLANRKAKRCQNTATAYRRFLSDIDDNACEDWPPGRLLELAAAKGWAGIFPPRETSARRPPVDEVQNPFVRAVLELDAERRAAASVAAKVGEDERSEGMHAHLRTVLGEPAWRTRIQPVGFLFDHDGDGVVVTVRSPSDHHARVLEESLAPQIWAAVEAVIGSPPQRIVYEVHHHEEPEDALPF